MQLADRRNTDEPRYTRVAMILHWMIAFFIILNLAIGPFMGGLQEPYRTLVARLHESSGITVLTLTVLRIMWRLTHRPPALDSDLTRVERATAHSVHFILYVAMLGLPLSGWAIISAHPPMYETVAAPAGGAAVSTTARNRVQKRIILWGLVPLEPIGPIQAIAFDPNGGKERQKALHESLARAHATAGYLLLAVLVLHILGALKHQWFDGHAEFYRMGIGPSSRRKRSA